jgi:hypothetical protein
VKLWDYRKTLEVEKSSNSSGNNSKNCQWDCIKLQSFFIAEEKITRVKWNYIMKEIFTRYSSDKVLLPGICKVVKKVHTKRTNNPVSKWTNEQFSREKVHMAKIHREKCLTSLAIKESEIKQHWDSTSPRLKGCQQEHKQQQMLVRMWTKRNSYSLLVET